MVIHVIQGYSRFLAKKISWFAFSGFKRDLLLVMMLPAVLNVLSEATLVAHEHRYRSASWERRGIRVDSWNRWNIFVIGLFDPVPSQHLLAAILTIHMVINS